MEKKRTVPKPLKVGDIWFHPAAGPARPFIVRRIEGKWCWSDNLDDGATNMRWPTADVARMERLGDSSP